MALDRSVITVDGLAASGKTALAKGLAQRLGFAHLNSGLLYRATALVALRSGVDLHISEDVVKVLRDHQIELHTNPQGEAEVLLDGQLCTQQLGAEEISEGASLVGRSSNVRAILLPMQQHAFPAEGLVAEGRDMGTVVFPEAQVKFFVTARLDVRAQRRYQQLIERGQPADLEQIRIELAQRDERDASREVAPMRAAPGAHVIDNSDQPLEKIIGLMLEIVKSV